MPPPAGIHGSWHTCEREDWIPLRRPPTLPYSRCLCSGMFKRKHEPKPDCGAHRVAKLRRSGHSSLQTRDILLWRALLDRVASQGSMMGSAGNNCADILDRFFSRANRTGLVSAYLFGSRITGRIHRESDLDVGILLDWRVHPTHRVRFEERLALSSSLIAALGANEVDVLILNDAPPLLAARIVVEGRRVFCAEPVLDRAFFRDVQLRAADLLPFLRRTRRLKLLALQR